MLHQQRHGGPDRPHHRLVRLASLQPYLRTKTQLRVAPWAAPAAGTATTLGWFGDTYTPLVRGLLHRYTS